jgi:transcription antitermination factor NusG
MQPEETPSAGWFAVKVKPKHEKSVSKILEYKGLEAFLPLFQARRRWSDRIRELQLPLFPGYVFSRFNPSRPAPILSTPGVYDVVRFGRTLAALDPLEITALQNLISSGLPSEPWPHLELGQVVEIEDGPLKGCKGVVVEFKKLPRLVLSVTLLRRSVLVELDRNWVRSITSSVKFKLDSLSAR